MQLMKKMMCDPKMEIEAWIYPKLCRVLYFVSFALMTLFVVVHAIVFTIQLNAPYGRVSVDFKSIVVTLLLWAVILPIFMVIALILARFGYEASLLLFRIFESKREQIEETHALRESLAAVEKTHQKAAQYSCDCLAEICDLLKGVNANASNS